MHVTVEIDVDGADRPPVGAPIRVEARDTSLQDVAATTLGVSEGQVRDIVGRSLDTVELTFERGSAPEITVWAHADADGDGRVSPGDYITMSSFVIPPGDDVRMVVTVRRV